VAAAATAALLSLAADSPHPEDWLTFATLGAAAALAQRLIIPVGRNHGFPLAVVFLVAAAILLPPQLVALMGLAQHVPDLIDRRFSWYITTFNTANYTVSTLAAWAAAQLIDSTTIGADLRWAAAGITAALVLVVVNQLTLGVMLRLARGRSLRSSGLLTPSALLADLALAGLGVVLARFWVSNPYLIPLAVVPLVLIQRSFTLLARLGESEERFRAMFEGAPTGTVIVDLDERIVSSNRAFEELIGYGKAELLGRRLTELISPADERPATSLREMLAGVRHRYSEQLRLRRKDGSDVAGQLAASLAVDAQRRPRFVIAMVEDLTERMHLEEQLRHSQKMEAVGQLAGGIAHDFNNLLTIIAGRTRFAIRALDADEGSIRPDLDEIAAAVERAAELTRQLLAYSRRQVLQPRVIDLNSIVTGMERMLRPLIGEHIEIKLDLASGLGRVRADPGQLEQVIVNLALNARDAMGTGGRLTIETANVEPSALVAAEGDPARGQYIMLAVRDTGHGMDETTRSHVFEPFFTTKDPGKGTGLGLSTVYGIIVQSGGLLQVDSAVGVGSTFATYLPIVEDEVAQEDERPPGAGEVTGSETLLLAEDDDGVRALAELMLSDHGFTVLAARDGIQALRIADQHEEPIDLLLTDVVMPRMNGPELADALAAVRPGIRVLYMSGYADASVIPEAAALAVVPKPFSEEVLVGTVREALDGPAAGRAAVGTTPAPATSLESP
jgi:two-component system, cell cycle sensor histidine kinase and response regulator CckA